MAESRAQQRHWEIQDGFDLRFDWGQSGVARLGPHVRTVVIVDVLRFTTAVETATTRGLRSYPYQWRDASARDFAASLGAILAHQTQDNPDGPSLSPRSLTLLEPGTRIVLPSQNGAMCVLAAANHGCEVTAGCLRNAAAVARWLETAPSPIGIIGCGELGADELLRPAVEDLVGAGAILDHLPGSHSPEAETALIAYRQVRDRLPAFLWESASARELLERGWDDDVTWSLQVDVSETVPILKDGCFIPAVLSAAASEGPP